MAPTTLVQPPPTRKSPRVVKTILSSDAKLLHPCSRCERPVFWCRLERAPVGPDGYVVAVHVLESRRGRIGIQATLGSDELVAVDVGKSARTFYSLHRCRRGGRS